MIPLNCAHATSRRAVGYTLMLLVSATSVFAQSPTFVRTDYPTLGNTHVVADFNGDGKPDLAGSAATAAAVMLGNGDGTFQPQIEYPVAGSAQDLAAGDFNGDGNLDLVVTINDPQIGLSLITGNGNGTFNPPVNFANSSGFDSPAIVATDLDNDGRLDLVIGHQIACFTAPCTVARSITVLRGNGNGTFQPPREIVVGSGTAKIAVGDFNRDGIKDLGLASDSSRVYILIGAGDGTFIQQPTLTLTQDTLGVDATDIDVADFNGDTIQDLVVAIALNGSRTAILIGNGNGSFQPPSIITEPAVRIPQYQAVADYNGDGFQDLALSLGWGTQGLMEIRNGNGNGTFQPLALYLVPPPQSSISGGVIASADFNGDGKPDIALAVTGASPALAILTNSTGSAPPPTPAAPTLVSPANGAINVALPVTLDWSDVANAASYEVQVDNSSTISAPFVANPTVSVSQVTLTGLPAQQLWWRVRARNAAGVAGPFSVTRRFTPQSAAAPAALSAVSVNPTSVGGGNTSQGRVTLTAAAPAGGFVVTLSDNSSAATTPASLTVTQGATTATFTVTTAAVTASTPVTITASAGGVTRSATLTVTPPGQGLTLTVTATGRSGERVISNPTGINVAVGNSGSASFGAGTTITLSVSNGRDAVWSGACSSGGNKTKTCTLTLNAAAAVTASVQ
jgi:VCBS repeat protein